MPLTKARGNMYGWVTHNHTHLAGECPHKCDYCYVQRGVARISGRYKGKLHLVREELRENYGEGKVIFIEHLNDLFASEVRGDWIRDILKHCRKYPENKYVFQTKNPKRILDFDHNEFPGKFIIGTTIETNFEFKTEAPSPCARAEAMACISACGMKTFITIEPVIEFDLKTMVEWITSINPEFVNIGADSKNSGLPEPSGEKVEKLIKALHRKNIIIKKKVNLERLLTTHNRMANKPVINPAMTPRCKNCNEPMDIYSNLDGKDHLVCSNCPTAEPCKGKIIRKAVKND